jgi:mannose/cellobiose epimerase-like protein (N-acyl-D-glucosamine 2-epimerase family)
VTVKLTTKSPPSLHEAANNARNWLLKAAAPRWATTGRTASGLFAERMSLAGEADSSYFRTFVQARHIFSFVAIGGLGWTGPWRELVGETMEAVICGGKRADGFYVHRLDAAGNPLDRRADLYDQAFVLFALGTAAGALAREDWIDEATQLVDRLETAWAHPLGGFREGEIVDGRVRRQNPHMHLLEAFLALHQASGRARFLQAAHSIADLAAARFIDPDSGALLEYFTDELKPAPGLHGRIAEPGHCFEWAWLFERLAETGWSEGVAVSDLLTSFARAYGIDANRGVAINEVLTDGTIHGGGARLWPQTERLKAAVARYRRLKTDEESDQALAANHGLARYLAIALPGLWRDKLNQDGTWIEEMVPGSSLYHISCAYTELARVAR